MKKILLLVILACAFVGCTYSVAPTASTYITDFRKYTEQGFIISPATTGFEYSPIAQISVVSVAGTEYNYLTGTSSSTQALNFDNVLERLVNDAKKLGANGILDFKIQSAGTGSYTLSGFAVKITAKIPSSL